MFQIGLHLSIVMVLYVYCSYYIILKYYKVKGVNGAEIYRPAILVLNERVFCEEMEMNTVWRSMAIIQKFRCIYYSPIYLGVRTHEPSFLKNGRFRHFTFRVCTVRPQILFDHKSCSG